MVKEREAYVQRERQRQTDRQTDRERVQFRPYDFALTYTRLGSLPQATRMACDFCTCTPDWMTIHEHSCAKDGAAIDDDVCFVLCTCFVHG